MKEIILTHIFEIAVITLIILAIIVKLLRKDTERKYVAEYTHKNDLSDRGYSNIRALIGENLERGYYITEEEDACFNEVYERFILFLTDRISSPDHKPDRRYMKSGKLYIMMQLYSYFYYTIDQRRNRDADSYYSFNEDGVLNKELNNTGIVALKMYLAAVKYLAKEGVISGYEIDSIKKDIDSRQLH